MFDFPATPTTGQQITMPDGTVRVWDGTKWVAGAYGQSAFVPLSGGTMTGPLVLSGNPAVALGAATKQYADTYANNAGRNLIHNALFNVAQRGAGPWSTASSYTVDRWLMAFSGGTYQITQQPMSDAFRAQIGDESARNYLSTNFTGGSAAGDFTQITQPIEDVRRLAGKTVVVSFWAIASTNGLKCGVGLYQNFGTGGSPSSGVFVPAVSVTLSTSWVRYNVTLNVPSIAGKTLGTAANDYTMLVLWGSSGATNNANAGGIGVQTGGISLYGVQLEIGSVATPLDYGGTPQQQLAACQRFFERFDWPNGGNIALSTTATSPPNAYFAIVPFKVTKRAAPTMTSSAASTFNAAGLAASSISLASDIYALKLDLGLSSGGGSNWDAFYVGANSSPGAWIAASADL